MTIDHSKHIPTRKHNLSSCWPANVLQKGTLSPGTYRLKKVLISDKTSIFTFDQYVIYSSERKSNITLGHYDTVAGLSTTLRLCKWWPISMIFYDIRFRFFFFYKDHTFLYESHCTNSYIATMKNGTSVLTTRQLQVERRE